MPCMLVSPDSLARFFPPRPGLFDLVVFDEASQIRVADAVGAMGRGRSVVVVGDSKQMPPTSFAELNLGGDGGDVESSAGADLASAEDAVADVLPAEDEESILSECVQARVPQRWLSWHYRSQDESLIAFSNRQYYAGGLSSFPAPQSGLPDPGSTATASTWSGSTATSTAAVPESCCAPTRSRPRLSSTRSSAGLPPTRTAPHQLASSRSTFSSER